MEIALALPILEIFSARILLLSGLSDLETSIAVGTVGTRPNRSD
jgi:hypothetical protein